MSSDHGHGVSVEIDTILARLEPTRALRQSWTAARSLIVSRRRCGANSRASQRSTRPMTASPRRLVLSECSTWLANASSAANRHR
jgi:hypothetical protein